MFAHIMIGCNDIDRSKAFYDAVMAVLGYDAEPLKNIGPKGHVRYSYAHGGNTLCLTEPINDEPATAANGSTIGFKCISAEQVKDLHDVAIANGGTSIEDPPGLREGSIGAMHLSYFRDPDGHKLCGVMRVR